MMAAQTALCVAAQTQAENTGAGAGAEAAGVGAAVLAGAVGLVVLPGVVSATAAAGTRLQGGGVMTPASACGVALVGRFAAHGVHFIKRLGLEFILGLSLNLTSTLTLTLTLTRRAL